VLDGSNGTADESGVCHWKLADGVSNVNEIDGDGVGGVKKEVNRKYVVPALCEGQNDPKQIH